MPPKVPYGSSSNSVTLACAAGRLDNARNAAMIACYTTNQGICTWLAKPAMKEKPSGCVSLSNVTRAFLEQIAPISGK